MLRGAACVFAALASVILLVRAVDRVRHPFWSKQPVMRPWKLWLCLGKDRVIDSSMPEPGRHPVESDAHGDVADLISQEYSPKGEFRHAPHADSIAARLSDGGLAVVVRETNGTPVGCATATKASLQLNGNSIGTNYVDHLCVATRSRGKNLASDLIGSLYAGARRAGAPPVFIFKHETPTTGMGAPLCLCADVLFGLEDLKDPSGTAHPALRKGGAVEMMAALRERDFKCLAMLSPPTVIALVESKRWFCWTLWGHWFVLKDAEFTGTKTLEMTAAVRAEGATMESFCNAFAGMLTAAAGEGWEEISLEALGDQAELVTWARTKCSSRGETAAVYYLYNYVAWQLKAQDCCFLL